MGGLFNWNGGPANGNKVEHVMDTGILQRYL